MTDATHHHAAPAPVAAAISEMTGEFVTKWIVLAETIDPEDGSESIQVYRDAASSRWDRLGLLEYAMEIERDRLHQIMKDLD